MRIIVTLSDRDPKAKALARQLATLAARQSASRNRSPFPFNLLERGLRTGLDGLEAVVRRAVLALGRPRD